MRKFVLTIGITLGLLSPMLAHAAVNPGESVFDLFYDAARSTMPNSQPSKVIVNYIIEEMKTWGGKGIIIDEAAIAAAIAGDTSDREGTGLCENKRDTTGAPIEFLQGGAGIPGSCLSLRNAILSLLNDEQEVEQLGSDLLSLANGSELAIADEPHRPLDMSLYAMLLRRVWSGTGAGVIPWDGRADGEVALLNQHLSAASAEDVSNAILRYRHGVFREQREADPRFWGVMDQIGADLKIIAARLQITGDATVVGVYSVPKLNVRNVGFWARKDDIGLMRIYPTHIERLEILPAGVYPEFRQNGGALAYPFLFQGNAVPTGPGIASPLCSRMFGREGYLCRPQPALDINCSNNGNPNAIILRLCPIGPSGAPEKVTETTGGPDVCVDFNRLYKDNGQPLTDPGNPGRLNPALTPIDPKTICSPDNRVLYQDDITSHACYIGHCVLESVKDHTLIPNRNPVVVNEATSPYLACIRPDPQLGLYTEIAEDSPYPLPEYLGQFLVRDFERQYCIRNGDAPQPLLGLCAFQDNENAALPIESQLNNSVTVNELRKAIALRGQDVESIAAAIGQRAAIDQTIEVERKTFARLSYFVQHVADLLLELKRAPLTQSACPWTGPFRDAP